LTGSKFTTTKIATATTTTTTTLSPPPPSLQQSITILVSPSGDLQYLGSIVGGWIIDVDY
jgi:hypothetical protein